MTPDENKKSFKELINAQVCQFIGKVQKIYDGHSRQFEMGRTSIDNEETQIFQAMINCVAPFEGQPMNNEALSNFLQSTLNHQTEKLKKMSIAKQMTYMSGCTKLLAYPQSMHTNQQNIIASPASHKPLLSTETPFNYKNSIKIENLLPFEDRVKQEHIIEQSSSSNSDSSSLYNSKNLSDIRKYYKSLTTEKKLEIIQYAFQDGINKACQKYKVSKYKILEWSRFPTSRRDLRGRRPIDPSLEQKMSQWLKNELEKGKVLTQRVIRIKAKQISCSDFFKASKGWLQKFFKRHPNLFEIYTQNRKISIGQVAIITPPQICDKNQKRINSSYSLPNFLVIPFDQNRIISQT